MTRLPDRALRWMLMWGVLAIVIPGSAIVVRQNPRASDAADFGEWTFIGPSNLVGTNDSAGDAHSGRVSSVGDDPADPNHWLGGAAMGGVWDTADAGTTWQPRTDGQPSLAMGAIAFSPTSPSVVYAGTGDANFA